MLTAEYEFVYVAGKTGHHYRLKKLKPSDGSEEYEKCADWTDRFNGRGPGPPARQGLFMDQGRQGITIEGNKVKSGNWSIGIPCCSMAKKELSTLYTNPAPLFAEKLIVRGLGLWIMRVRSSCARTRNMILPDGNWYAKLSVISNHGTIIAEGNLEDQVFAVIPKATQILSVFNRDLSLQNFN